MSATLSSKARPAFTEPLSQTSLPVAPTVTFTMAKGVGIPSVTLSQGAVVQGQALHPPLYPTPLHPSHVFVAPLMASCAPDTISEGLEAMQLDKQLLDPVNVLSAVAVAPAESRATLAPLGFKAENSRITGIMLIQERPGQEEE